MKKFKLNAERNNGRAAMMGITGMIVHNALGVDSLLGVHGRAMVGQPWRGSTGVLRPP